MKKMLNLISAFFSKAKCLINWKNVKKAFTNTKAFTCKVINNNKSCLILIVVISLFTNLLQEWMLREKFSLAFKLVYSSPITFLFNSLIILATYSLIYLFRRRILAFFTVNISWIIIAFVQMCLMTKRTTPFNASDFRVLKSGFSIIPQYFSTFQIFLLILAAVVILAIFVFLFIKSPKCTAKRLPSSLITIVICTSTLIATYINVNLNLDTAHFSNLPNAFRKYGFTYCFLCSIIDNGIDKPDNYSIEAIKTVVDKTNTEVDNQTIPVTKPGDGTFSIDDITVDLGENEYPNIIFLQLESFYDVNNIDGYKYSQNPIPFFTSLKEKYPHALFRVPSIGAGTANTEFEVLTGMEVVHFGIAEYPYLSVLQNNTCESMSYITKPYGYTSHAIHNHRGTFYDRNKVFPNLGFDTFTSIESMPDITRNANKWAKDSMLKNEIIRALEYSPEGPDLVYTISVQPHGRYPDSRKNYEKLLNGQEPLIKLYGNDDNPENPGINYYINELYEVDLFLEDLVTTLAELKQPTVLVMFGDHLPAFSVEEWVLSQGDCYQTEYVIWNNCNLDFTDAPDLTSFQLSSYIFKKLGITDGQMNKLNQTYVGTDTDYSNDRWMLEYDMLYGKQYALEETPEYLPTENIKLGLANITIDQVIAYDNKCYILGENFNAYSHIRINDRIVDTSSLNKDATILVIDKIPNENDIITVVQRATNHTVLGQSSNYTVFNSGMIVESEPEFLKQQEDQQIIPQEPLDDAQTPADVEADLGGINNEHIESLG